MKRSKIVSFLKKTFMSESADQKKFNADLKSFKSQGGEIDKILPIVNEHKSNSACLHTIEHFGLGRYGDKIDPNGHIKGFNNILKLLSSNAKLYISFPVGGIKTKIIFNAHRVFKSTDVLSWAKKEYNLELINFDIVNDLKIYRNKSLNFADQFDYACGIYTFKIK